MLGLRLTKFDAEARLGGGLPFDVHFFDFGNFIDDFTLDRRRVETKCLLGNLRIPLLGWLLNRVDALAVNDDWLRIFYVPPSLDSAGCTDGAGPCA